MLSVTNTSPWLPCLADGIFLFFNGFQFFCFSFFVTLKPKIPTSLPNMSTNLIHRPPSLGALMGNIYKKPETKKAPGRSSLK